MVETCHFSLLFEWPVADLTGRAVRKSGPRSYRSFKYSCTNWTAIAPSPTAAATRLTEPDRTSPAANTPGRLVSRKYGYRRADPCGDCVRSEPVRTKPLSSLSISGGSQSVRGTVPIKLNTAVVSPEPPSP